MKFLKIVIDALNQLPIILKNDPIAKLIRLSINDIYEIKRPSIKSGDYSFIVFVNNSKQILIN